MLKENKQQKESVLEELIVEILLPMVDVVVRKDRVGRISVFKEGIKFGIIEDHAFHLFDKSGEYQKIGREIFFDADKLLLQSTKAYCYACGKMNFSKHS